MEAEIRQLRWQCRRGMLELDLMLGTFLEKAYAQLGPMARLDFKKLLEVSDHTLYAWLIGQSIPETPALQSLVTQIRHVLSETHSIASCSTM